MKNPLPAMLFFFRRATAFLVDGIIVFFCAMIVFFAFYAPTVIFSGHSFTFDEIFKVSRLSSEWMQWLEALIELAIYVAYFTYFHSRHGATPGKRLLRLRVVDDLTGERLSVGRSLGRFFAYFFSMAPFGTGFLMALFHPRRTTLHDWVVGSKVVPALKA